MDTGRQRKRNGFDDLRSYLGLFACQALAAELGGIVLSMFGQQGYAPLVISLMLLFVYLLTSPLALLLLISASAFDLSKPMRLFGVAAIYLGYSSIVLWGGHFEPWRLATAAWLSVVPTLFVWLWSNMPVAAPRSDQPQPFVPLRERLRRADAARRRSGP